jgi:SAM-dependent methyltransferase
VDEAIHRRLARLVDAHPEQDVLWVGCGGGRSALWWAERFDGRVYGVDADPEAVERAESAARAAGLAPRATFQVASPEDLPHQPQTFDLVIVHTLYLPAVHPETALREAARVVRPMGVVAAILPTWLSVAAREDAGLVESLGFRPQQVMEWKQRFRDAGLVELQVDDAATDDRWLAARWPGLGLRAWRSGRWPALRAVLAKPVRVLRRLARRRILGLSLLRGSRWPHP